MTKTIIEFQQSANFRAISSCQEGGKLGIDHDGHLYSTNSWFGKKWISFKQFFDCRNDFVKVQFLIENTTRDLLEITSSIAIANKLANASTEVFAQHAQTLNLTYTSLTGLQKGLSHLKFQNISPNPAMIQALLQKAYSYFTTNFYMHINGFPTHSWDVSNNTEIQNKIQMDHLQTFHQIADQVQRQFPDGATKIVVQVAAKVNLVGKSIFKKLDSFEKIVQKCVPLHQYPQRIQTEKRNLEDLKKRIVHVPARYYNLQRLNFFQRAFSIPHTVEVELAFEKGQSPRLLGEGISGTYLMPDRTGKPCGIFKPADQECGLKANPKGGATLMGGSAFGIKPGSSYIRERLAYLLDKNHFANIPMTSIETFSHRKFVTQPASKSTLIGSFQVFQSKCQALFEIIPKSIFTVLVNKTSLTNYFRSFFVDDSSQIPLDQVHALAVFDMRTLNCDRHLNNALIGPSYDLHPIDHGFILPSNAHNIQFSWMDLPQTKKPFNPVTLKYISQLDENSDAALLRQQGIEEEAVQRLIIATKLLKKAAKARMTPWQIADFMKGKVPLRSHFEQKICTRIFAGESAETVIVDELNKYLRR